MAESNAQLWWTWYVAGYRGNELISAKAVNQEHAEYVAELFRRDGLRKVLIKDNTRS
jgi:hypothetical protein